MQKIFLVLFLLFISALCVAQPNTFTKSKAHIYLLVGQSNMAGRGIVAPQDTITDPHIWMFTKEAQWVPAKDPMAFDKPKVVGVGPGLAFAKKMREADTEALICVVPTAVGGTRIDLWKAGAYDSATQTHPWDDAIDRAKKAITYGELKGIIWHQGESDANAALLPSYEAKLRELIQRFRTTLGKPDLPIVLGEVGVFKDSANPRREMVNTIIRKVAETTPNCALAESNDLQHKGDFTHFDAASARELGKRFAAAMRTIKK